MVPTAVVHGTKKKLNWHLTFTEKNIFVSGMGQKIFLSHAPQYYYGTCRASNPGKPGSRTILKEIRIPGIKKFPGIFYI